MTRMRGRVYEDGPYTFCDNFDRHGIGCTCAMPPLSMPATPPFSSLLQDFYRTEVTQAAPPEGGCFWPMDDAEVQP